MDELNNIEPIKALLQPLMVREFDSVYTSNTEDPTEALYKVIKELTEQLGDNPVEVIKNRYDIITDKNKEPLAFPAAPAIINTLKPLMDAKWCYILNMPIPCIAQSGLVGEMVALLHFDMLNFKLNEKSINTEGQERIFGKPFEKLSQYRRVEVLKEMGSLEEEDVHDFKQLRETRNKYLHVPPEIKEIDFDALKAYNHALNLVCRVSGVGQNRQIGVG